MADLEPIAKLIDGQLLGESVCGTHHGVMVLLSLTTRDVDDSASPWTLVTAELPAKYPLELHVSEQTPSRERDVERGLRVDVTVGDPAFDAAYVVEAAPADVVCRLLDPDTRQLVRRVLVGGDLTTSERRLVMTVPGWLVDPARAMPAIELVARIASRVREAFADETVQAGIYRDQPDGAAERERIATREAEVAHVRAVRDSRHARVIAAGLGVMFVMVLVLVLSLRAC